MRSALKIGQELSFHTSIAQSLVATYAIICNSWIDNGIVRTDNEEKPTKEGDKNKENEEDNEGTATRIRTKETKKKRETERQEKKKRKRRRRTSFRHHEW